MLLGQDDPGHTLVPPRPLTFLLCEGEHGDASRPDVVMFDINLPTSVTWQGLARIKANEASRCIPVIVLTSSQAEGDLAASHTSHAKAYVAKPMAANDFAIAREVDALFTRRRLGVVNYEIGYADGLRNQLSLMDQLVPFHVLRQL